MQKTWEHGVHLGSPLNWQQPLGQEFFGEGKIKGPNSNFWNSFNSRYSFSNTFEPFIKVETYTTAFTNGPTVDHILHKVHPRQHLYCQQFYLKNTQEQTEPQRTILLIYNILSVPTESWQLSAKKWNHKKDIQINIKLQILVYKDLAQGYPLANKTSPCSEYTYTHAYICINQNPWNLYWKY